MQYSFAIERGEQNLPEIVPLYRQHYGEMQDRLAADGVSIGDYNPRWDEYIKAWVGGWLINYIARIEGVAVGYSNVYITQDMHNGELIAQEDTIYFLPDHRNGTGRKFVKFILDDLRQRGVKRAFVTTQTDLRTGLLCKRLGFKDVAAQLMYSF
jgi:GNAT superfamily N-acetyltransferase